MPLSITLPLLGKGGDTRDLVISILSEEWPLTAKEIHNRAKSIGKNVTYQAVHKAVKLLEEEHVVKQLGKEYSLAEEWIQKIKEFSEALAQKQTSSEKALNPKAEFPATITVQNMIELGYLAIRFSEQTYFSSGEPAKEDLAIAHWRHTWPGVFMVEKEFERLKRIFTVPHFVLVQGNTAMDRFLAKGLEQMGAKVRLGEDCAGTQDVVVHKDFVLYIHYPSKLREALEKEYDKAKTEKELDLAGLQQAVHGNYGPIMVTIFRNPDLAKQITEETLARFPKQTK